MYGLGGTILTCMVWMVQFVHVFSTTYEIRILIPGLIHGNYRPYLLVRYFSTSRAQIISSASSFPDIFSFKVGMLRTEGSGNRKTVAQLKGVDLLQLK